jgi:hypothetical protein
MPPNTFTARFEDRLLATANDVTALPGDPAVVIVDGIRNYFSPGPPR